MESIITTSSYVSEIDRQVVLTTSALQNLRNLLAQDSNKFIPTKRSKWPKNMRYECELLRTRIDDLMGSITILLSMCSREPIEGVNISAENANLALASCVRSIPANGITVQTIEKYGDYINDFVGSLLHGSSEVEGKKAVEYYKRSLELSSMLVSW